MDGAGNENYENNSSTTLYLDQTPPTAPGLVSPENNATVYTATVTLDWSAASDATSGVDNYKVYVDGGLVATVDSTQTSYDHTFAEGSHTWHVRAVDYAGNENSSGTYNLTYTPNVAPEVLGHLAPIADVNVEYDVRVEVRDNDNLSNVNEVWLVLYSGSVALGDPDNTRNHYTFKWVRGVGFSEVGPGAANEHLNVAVSTVGNDSLTRDNYTFRVKLGKVAEPTTWNVWARVIDAAGTQDNRTFTGSFTVNPYIELSLDDASLSFSGAPGETVGAGANPTIATVTSNYDFNLEVRVAGDWTYGAYSFGAENTKADADGVAPYDLDLTSTGQALYTNVGWGSGVTRDVYWFLTIPSVPPGTYSNTLYVRVS